MATSYSFLLLFLLLVVPPCLCLFDEPDIPKPTRRPHVVVFQEDPEAYKQRFLVPRKRAPWIAVDEERVTEALSNTSGFRIASAILQKQHPLNSLLVSVDMFFKQRDGPMLFVPNCDGITVYIRELENEDEIVEEDPKILDELLSGRRHVERLNKTVERFNGGGNVSLSHPYLYTPAADADDFDHQGLFVHGAHRFGSLELPHARGGGGRGGGENNHHVVEMVIVASVVPDQYKCDIDRDSEYGQLLATLMSGEDLETAVRLCKEHQMPYGTTMLISLLF